MNPTIFLAGPDENRDLAIHLRGLLRDDGYDVLWHKGDFDVSGSVDAVSVCIRNAEKCDLLVLILGYRTGAVYDETGISISEAEFRAARAAGKDAIVLVRDHAWSEYRIWANAHGAHSPPSGQAEAMDGFLTDSGVLRLIDKFQHEILNNRPAVPWIADFRDAFDAHKIITEKWVLFRTANHEVASERERLPLLAGLASSPEPLDLHPYFLVSASLEEMQAAFGRVFNDGPTKSEVDTLACYLSESGGRLTSEKARRYEHFGPAFANYCEALFRLCNAIKLSVQAEAFNKFPNVCAYCHQFPCRQTLQRPLRDDGKYHRRQLLEIAQRARNEGKERPFSLDGWGCFICEIYPRNWDMDVPLLVERLHEEQSELIKSVRVHARKRSVARFGDVAEEVADVLSWLTVYGARIISLIRRFSPPSMPEPTLGHFVHEQYAFGCPRCGYRTCSMKDDCRL